MTRAALVAALLAGCASMAPAYERPASPVPARLTGGGGSASAAALPWHDFIREPRLQKIVEQAIAQSRDLRKAVLAIDAARAQYRIQRSTLLPSIDAVAAITSARTVFSEPGLGSTAFTSTTYSAQVGFASWEIDLFGRLRSLSSAKLQAYLATIDSARATRISLLAEVAGAYVTLAADRSRLAIARDTMTSSQHTMELTDKIINGGVSNRGDYYQAETVFQQARADVALLTATLAQDRDALELLAGGPIADDLLPDALPAQLDWFADVPVGLSSAVLLERPDVAAAEHQLMSANANIGAARAQFFPQLTLTASGGLESATLASLFTGPAAAFTLAPQLALPLFNYGANRANLAYSKTEKLVYIASYEQAIQSAFRDVADALATKGTIEEQLDAQVALVAAAQKGFDLAQARYREGVDPFLTTLVSERALYAAKNSLAATQLAALGNRVTLYRVLGGGLR